VDNHERLTRARAAINELRKRDPGRAEGLDERLGELPRFEGQVLTPQRFKDLLAVWQPANRGETERNQTGLKDGWQKQFGELFRELEDEARR
jgi:hypothetical protein